jgi:ribose/xylose/arabinose/galactoside ABC-type transport system permease subunit
MDKRIERFAKKTFHTKSFGLFVIWVFVVALFSLINHNYFNLGNFRTILYNAALPGTLMVGFSTLLISGNADMSVAAVGGMSAITCCKMIVAGVPWPLAVLIALCMGGAMGALNALLWYKFRITPFIGTMGISYVWQGLAAYITKNQYVNVNNPSFFKLGEGALFGFLPKGFLYVIILCAIFGIVLSRTKFGRQVYMCGGNMFAARLSGVNIVKIGTVMMVICSALSAFGGIVLSSRMHQISVDSMSTSLMNSITATFLGGVSFGGGSGSMVGAFIGLLMLVFFNNGLVIVGVGTYWQFAAQGVLLIVALAVDYFGDRSRSKMLKAEAG